MNVDSNLQLIIKLDGNLLFSVIFSKYFRALLVLSLNLQLFLWLDVL